MNAERILGPEPLGERHEVDSFDCRVRSLNEYLKERALPDQRAEKSRTYVVSRGDRVVGYFSLAAAAVEPETATDRAAKGQGRQMIPAILLARLGVDRRDQGQGLGQALLIEALRRAANAAETIGARVVLVDAFDDSARRFYLRYGFEPSPTDPLHLMLLMKDIRKSV